MNNEMFNLMKEQLKEKDLQIQEKDKQLEKLIDLNKNSQILQLKQQPQDTKLLEEHFNNLDVKLEEVKNNMNQRKEQQQKKSIFSIFKSRG